MILSLEKGFISFLQCAKRNNCIRRMNRCRVIGKIAEPLRKIHLQIEMTTYRILLSPKGLFLIGFCSDGGWQNQIPCITNVVKGFRRRPPQQCYEIMSVFLIGKREIYCRDIEDGYQNAIVCRCVICYWGFGRVFGVLIWN